MCTQTYRKDAHLACDLLLKPIVWCKKKHDVSDIIRETKPLSQKSDITSSQARLSEGIKPRISSAVFLGTKPSQIRKCPKPSMRFQS